MYPTDGDALICHKASEKIGTLLEVDLGMGMNEEWEDLKKVRRCQENLHLLLW